MIILLNIIILLYMILLLYKIIFVIYDYIVMSYIEPLDKRRKIRRYIKT